MLPNLSNLVTMELEGGESVVNNKKMKSEETNKKKKEWQTATAVAIMR